MGTRGPSFSVPNAVGVPRLKDVALFLCGRAIAAEWSEMSAADTAMVEDLAAWYLRSVSQMDHRSPKKGFKTFHCSSGEEATTNKADHLESSEANFSIAFRALSEHPNETNLRVRQQMERESHQRGQESADCSIGEHREAFDALLCGAEFEGGEDELRMACVYFEEMLDICRNSGNAAVCNDLIYHIISFSIDDATLLDHPFQMLWGKMHVDDRAAVILPILGSLFSLCDVTASQYAAGSITRSFAMWLGVSWGCASFMWQSHVARATGCLLAELEKKLILSKADDAATRDTRPPTGCARRITKSSQKTFKASGCGKELNIASMHAAMRRTCEGCGLYNKGLLELLVQSESSSALPLSDYNNVLEYIFNEQAMGTSGGAQDAPQQQWHYSILSNIMNGVLLYSQFYLSVRSLEASLRCAQMGVLVGHQWRSSELLTIAHYSSFLVHVACQDTPAAAGDIAIMLQLADAAVRRDGCGETYANAARFHAGCLGYMGAALLLLIAPGTVDTSLRSIIITGIVAGLRPTWDPAGGNGGLRSGANGKGNSSVSALQCSAAEAATGGGSVVVQTTAQTVRHALWLSEMEAFLDPSSTLVTEVVTSVARSTLMLIAGHYGVCSYTTVIDTGFLAQQLSLIERAACDSLNTECEPSALLLRETIRQVAHHAMAVQVGAVEPPSGAGPFGIIHSYLLAVEEHYGNHGVEVVQQNFFFASTYHFLCAMWLRAHGYLKSAYQELTRLADSMLFHSRCRPEFINSKGSGSTAAEPTPLTAAPSIVRTNPLSSTQGSSVFDGAEKSSEMLTGEEERLQFWPPDHLILWQHVQFERAQLAHYLGYSYTLPEISDDLRSVSAASHFVMGVLYADLIATMTWMQRKNLCSALQALEKIEKNAESIGLTLVSTHARIRRVSVLMGCSRWQEAFDTLREMEPLPSILGRWHLLALLNVQSELLMSCAEATEEELAAVVEESLQQMEDCGCFGDEAAQKDSVGITLLEKLCIYACVSRHAVTTSRRQQRSWEKSLNELAAELKQRQLQEGKWQLLRNMPMKSVCNEVLTGKLIERVVNTP